MLTMIKLAHSEQNWFIHPNSLFFEQCIKLHSENWTCTFRGLTLEYPMHPYSLRMVRIRIRIRIRIRVRVRLRLRNMVEIRVRIWIVCRVKKGIPLSVTLHDTTWTINRAFLLRRSRLAKFYMIISLWMNSKTSWRVILLLTWILEKTSPETECIKWHSYLNAKLFFSSLCRMLYSNTIPKVMPLQKHSTLMTQDSIGLLKILCMSVLSWAMVWSLNGKRCNSSLALKNASVRVWIQLNLLSLNRFTYYSRIIHANCSKHYNYKPYSLNCNILLHWSYIQNIITYVLHFDYKYHSK